VSSIGTARTLVDVGGYRLAVEISGSGGPPVVCLSCLGGSHDEWAGVVEMLSAMTTCVTYGRPALGGSEPLPAEQAERARTGRWAANELRTLLRRLNLTPPYVLATSSIGAYVADQFVAAWPTEVAGVVLIDPTGITPFPIERPDASPDADGGISFSRKLCLTEQRNTPPAAGATHAVVLSSAVGRWLRNEPMEWHQPLTLAEVDHLWQGMQREWVERLAADHVIADTAGHFVHKDASKLTALVIEAVVTAARSGDLVHLGKAGVAAAGGRVRDHRT
jgi:pimeloyl-ACP methyl ester carboxylesterase